VYRAEGGKNMREYRCMVIDKVEEAKWKGLCVKRSLATDDRYNDGISSGHMWNDIRTMQTQRNMVVE